MGKDEHSLSGSRFNVQGLKTSKQLTSNGSVTDIFLPSRRINYKK
jgi:hypothetical protein